MCNFLPSLVIAYTPFYDIKGAKTNLFLAKCNVTTSKILEKNSLGLYSKRGAYIQMHLYLGKVSFELRRGGEV